MQTPRFTIPIITLSLERTCTPTEKGKISKYFISIYNVVILKHIGLFDYDLHLLFVPAVMSRAHF